MEVNACTWNLQFPVRLTLCVVQSLLIGLTWGGAEREGERKGRRDRGTPISKETEGRKGRGQEKRKEGGEGRRKKIEKEGGKRARGKPQW